MDPQTIAKHNARTFILYRILFRARFYYPVFTLLFLDFGLSLSQFAILNSVWALTIVLFEIPLGGLADTIGRRKIVILSAILLNIELLVWLFAPINGGNTLFIFFLVNRIISGLCEAASSGADEALVYDSLEKANLQNEWAETLEKTQRYTSLYFMFVLFVGAMIYDPNVIGKITQFFGYQGSISQENCIKLPIILNQIAAVFVLINALRFKETWNQPAKITEAFRDSFKKVFTSIQWIKKSKIVILLLLIVMFSESLILQFLTLMQQYWKVINIPILFYGIIGSGLAFFASLVPTLGKYCFKRFQFKTNFSICYLNLIIAYILIALSIPYIGILPVILLYCTYQSIIYFNGCYIHDACEESYRATVLSVQSMLSFSKYGIVSILYSFLVAAISNNMIQDSLNLVFDRSLVAFPSYFAFSTLSVLLLYKFFNRKRGSIKTTAFENQLEQTK
ncbi:MAG: MFS transporter [Opitutae bacterium]|nr:MFS transporter [Opitutae bacterium]